MIAIGRDHGGLELKKAVMHFAQVVLVQKQQGCITILIF